MTSPYLFIALTSLLLTPRTRKRPPQSGSVQTGIQDSTFSSFAFQFGGESKSSPTAIALQANGQVVVGGAVNDASPIFGGLARLDSNGNLDTTFGSSGSLTTDNSVSGLLIQTDGKIVAVEQLGSTGIVVARYLAN
jgi:hypothetical protein